MFIRPLHQSRPLLPLFIPLLSSSQGVCVFVCVGVLAAAAPAVISPALYHRGGRGSERQLPFDFKTGSRSVAGERSSGRAPPLGVQSHRRRVLFRLRQEVIHLLVLAALPLCNRHQKTVLIFPSDMILPQIPTKGPSILSSCWRCDTSLPRLRSNPPTPPHDAAL